MVGDVSREVHREPNADDEHDHADDVKVDVDDGHEADHAHLHRDDGEDDPDDAGLVGYEDQCDGCHACHAAAINSQVIKEITSICKVSQAASFNPWLLHQKTTEMLC